MHVTETYSVIKKNKILTFVEKWMQPDNIMLSEISQTQKDKSFIFMFTSISTS